MVTTNKNIENTQETILMQRILERFDVLRIAKVLYQIGDIASVDEFVNTYVDFFNQLPNEAKMQPFVLEDIEKGRPRQAVMAKYGINEFRYRQLGYLAGKLTNPTTKQKELIHVSIQDIYPKKIK